ncbi:MAG: GAF domain-containing protein [Acidobacteria bacterium]|nr:GAF domain-containing protein [Acidobacteriota bacterium]
MTLDSHLIELYEAREALLSRINPDAVSLMDIEKFLLGAVTEIGQRLKVDRCNIITPTPEGGYRVSHEYLGDTTLTPGVGLNIPAKLVPLETIRKYMPKARYYSVDDSTSGKVPLWVRTTLQLIGTRAILVAPFVIRNELFGVLGLHYCHRPHRWTETEIQLVGWLASQVSIGLQFTQLYQEKEREVELTRLMLEISNDISSRTDFSEITELLIDRGIELLKADYGAIAILDPAGELLHFDGARSRRGFDLRKSVEARFREARVLRLADHPMVAAIIEEARSVRLNDEKSTPLGRYLFASVLSGKSALIVPIKVKERVLGIIAIIWHTEEVQLSDYDLQLLEGMSSQLGIALEKDRLATEVLRLKRQLNDQRAGERIIGTSAALRRVVDLSLSVSDSNTTVLLQGESGTGKELIASLIQFNSRRASRPFIKINCGAITESLLETELFGHERGAFTDARSRRVGRFEEASGGTLFLDEIGEMSLSAQVSLLRILQDGEFTRVGGSEVIRTDVRVIAATNKNLEDEIERGRFRRDLYYRLNVYPIHLPPLRERRDDIEQLVAYFIDRYQQKIGRRVTGISDQALNMLRQYSWPGNVRELENCLERAVIMAAGRVITDTDLPEAIRSHQLPLVSGVIEILLPKRMDEIEEVAINHTLLLTNGDKAKAARLLGIGRKTLYRKLDDYRRGV